MTSSERSTFPPAGFEPGDPTPAAPIFTGEFAANNLFFAALKDADGLLDEFCQLRDERDRALVRVDELSAEVDYLAGELAQTVRDRDEAREMAVRHAMTARQL